MSNNDMKEFAENLWNNYIKKRIEEECSDEISFYRAAVSNNNGDGTLNITIPFDGEKTIQCTRELLNVNPSANVLVLRMGNGNAGDNHIAVAEMDSINPDFKIIKGQIEGGTGLKVLLGGLSVSGSITENSLTSVRDYAACYNNGLTEIDMGRAKTIGSNAFFSCYNLSEVSFPVCTSIGEYAFYGCYRLVTLNLPECKSIDSNAFMSCNRLASASLAKCEYIGDYAFAYCYSWSNLSFPSCKTIGNYAFVRNSSLTTISLPICSNIGTDAFRYCTRLISLDLTKVSRVTSINESVFYSTPIGGYSDVAGQYGSVYVPSSLYAAFCSATNWTSISARIVPV